VLDLADEQPDDAITGEVPVVAQSPTEAEEPVSGEEVELEAQVASDYRPGSDEQFETKLESWVSSSEPQRRW
jgi:hypothetical protein